MSCIHIFIEDKLSITKALVAALIFFEDVVSTAFVVILTVHFLSQMNFISTGRKLGLWALFDIKAEALCRQSYSNFLLLFVVHYKCFYYIIESISSMIFFLSAIWQINTSILGFGALLLGIVGKSEKTSSKTST